ncbi:MAG: hypothetical protein ACRET4_04030 [Steroidobacteraceae bacterium]
MLSTRAHVIIFFSLLGAIVAFAIAGNILQAEGVIKPEGLGTPFKVFFLLPVAALAFSGVPMVVKLVLGFHKAVGNQDVGPIRQAIANEKYIVFVLWGLMAAGLALAIPAAIQDGAFGPASASDDAGPSEGRLVARPGMLVADMFRQSSLKLKRNADLPAQEINPLPIAGGANFEFEIAGTGFVVRNCRYYFVSSYTHDRQRVEAINVGTSPHKVSRAEVEQANAAMRARLKAEGWLTGHEVYRDEEDRTLHGGATQGPEGATWLKDDVVLDIANRRMDDEVPGEDKATVGEWIQYLDVWPRKDYPGIDRLVFAPPTQ